MFKEEGEGNNKTIGKYTKPLNDIMNITFVIRNFLYWVENDLFFVILMIFSRVQFGFWREFRNGNVFYSIDWNNNLYFWHSEIILIIPWELE